MTVAPSTVIAYGTRRSHEAVLRLIDDLNEEQLAARRGQTAPCIAFHLWHLARWADLLQSRMPGMTSELGRRLGDAPQIWDAEGIAQKWGLDSASLGQDATGMGMADDAAESLALPGKQALLDYARRAFEAANRAVAAADDEQLAESCTDLYGRQTSVGAAVLSHLAHVNRHLGMIEALRGVHGLRGTATV